MTVGRGQGDASFPPRGQVTVRPCEHTVQTAKFKSSSEPPKEIAARRVAPADLAVQLELVVVHLQHEGRFFVERAVVPLSWYPAVFGAVVGWFLQSKSPPGSRPSRVCLSPGLPAGRMAK